MCRALTERNLECSKLTVGSRNQGLRKVDLTQVHIETLRQDGQWHWFTDFCHRSISSVANIEPGATESPSSERAETVGRLSCHINSYLEPLNSGLQDFPSIQPNSGADFEHGMLNNSGVILLPKFMAQDVRQSTTQSYEQCLDAGGHLHLESSNVPASGTIFCQSSPLSLPQNLSFVSLEPGRDVWELDIREEGFLQDVNSQPLALWGSQWLQNLPLRRLDTHLQREGEKIKTGFVIRADLRMQVLH